MSSCAASSRRRGGGIAAIRRDIVAEVPTMGTLSLTGRRGQGINNMRIIAKRTLKVYWEKVPAAKAPLQAWHAEARNTEWSRSEERRVGKECREREVREDERE